MSDNEIAEQTPPEADTEAGAERELSAEEQRQLEEVRERRRDALAQVRTFGDPVLKSKASQVTEFGPHLDAEAERMFALMHDALGIGLAATQLGAMRRMLVFQAGPDAAPRAIVNPEIQWFSEELVTAEEGCLSLPGIAVDVERPLYARVSAQDTSGARILLEASGLEARVLQHEIDHLDGVLILDRTVARSATRCDAGAAQRRELQPRGPRRRRPRRRRPAGGRARPLDLSRADMALANAYLGTSEFAATVLGILAASEHRPALVVTPPDRPAGRGRKLSPPPVAVLAEELGLPLHQTPSINDAEAVAAVRAAGVAACSVCAFGQLIGAPLLGELPMLNIHPSLLPRWRGAAPIERAIMAGDEHTGVAVMSVTAGLDSGPVALLEEEPIGADDDFGTLAPRLAERGGRMLVEALGLLEAGSLQLAEQDDAAATYAEKIEAADRRLDPRRPARELELVVRALNPHIGAYLELAGGDRLRVRSARAVAAGEDAGPPGTARAAEDGLRIACAGDELAIAELQPAGKRPMIAVDWLRGNAPPELAGGTA